MFDEFLEHVEDNLTEAEVIFKEYYDERAYELGEDLIDNGSIEDDDSDLDPIEVYEKYAASLGYDAEYEGARGIIVEMGEDYELDEDDDILKEEILGILGKEL